MSVRNDFKKFVNMKNRKKNRLVGYDYSKNNLYFVTSCVKDMQCCFGYIKSVETNSILPAENNSEKEAVLDLSINEFLVTPIRNPKKSINDIAKMELNQYGNIVNSQLKWLEIQYPYISLHAHIVMPNHIHAIIEINSNVMKTNVEISEATAKIKIKSLSQIMGAFKTTSSKIIHNTGFEDFSWHRSFHDHIIRDERAYFNIINYIRNNPNVWYSDKFNLK